MICIQCIHLAPLKKHIVKNGAFAVCSYCSTESICVHTGDMFEYISARMTESYRVMEELTHYEQMMFFHGSEKVPLVEYWSVLQEEHDIGVEKFVDELVEFLEEDFGVDDEGNEVLYALDDGTLTTNLYEQEWNDFIKKIHHAHRYFNDGARTFLDSIFQFACSGDRLKPELVSTLDVGDSLYRARKASSESKLKEIEAAPAQSLGPAPNNLAGNQRMTPSGISAMYCALERETCLSEIRAVTGDLVISGEFNPVRPMPLLDLRKLEVIARFDKHPFDEGYARASHAYHFLKNLIFKLSKPKSSNDNFGYIQTQVVFEYLRIRFNVQVCGIIFPSVQTGLEGTNVVVFPESALIAPVGYSIENESSVRDPWDFPIPLIAFKESSIRVHKIKAVLTKSDDYLGSVEYAVSKLV